MLSEDEIQEAGRVIRGGGVVAMPTETVYGLGANALDADAVARVFAAKARPSFDPLIVHVPDAASAWALVDLEKLPEAQRKIPGVLAEAFWPGPLTMVLPRRKAGKPEFSGAGNESEGQEKRQKKGWRQDSPEKGTVPLNSAGVVSEGGGVPGIVTSGLDTVGVRVPRHPVALGLLRAAGVPIAAPSANVFGGISPTRAEHVTVDCDMVLDGGPCATGVESTVVGFTGEPGAGSATGVVVLRLGGASVEEIERVVGGAVAVARPSSSPGGGAAQVSPGMLDRHYAPRTPMRLVLKLEALDPASLGNRRAGLLSLRGEQGRGMGFAAAEVLSATGDLTAAAAQLFDAMHRLDAAGLDVIVAEAVPEQGIGRAINDRLRRAATAE